MPEYSQEYLKKILGNDNEPNVATILRKREWISKAFLDGWAIPPQFWKTTEIDILIGLLENEQMTNISLRKDNKTRRESLEQAHKELSDFK